MEVASSTQEKVTKSQLQDAEEGLRRLLYAKNFRRSWVEEQISELMAQAQADFAVRLAAGREDDTVNLLVVIAYRRALKVIRKQKTTPPTTSIETVFHLADDSTPTPEQETLEHDRQGRIVKAMSHLPERDRKLLALVYFGEMTVRDAGRRLGWGKSSADRHHRAALERMRALVGDRELLGAEIAIPAFIAAGSPSPLRSARMWVEGAAETTQDAALVLANRFGPAADSGNAAAMSGAGRATAGVCGAAVVACLATATTGLVGPGIGAVGSGPGEGEGKRAVPQPTRQASKSLIDPLPVPPEPERVSRMSRRSSQSSRRPSRPAPPRPEPPRVVTRPSGETRTEMGEAVNRRYTQHTVNEFGIERGQVEESPAPEPAPVPATEPVQPSSPVTARPPARSSSPPPQSGGSSGSSSEFGM